VAHGRAVAHAAVGEQDAVVEVDDPSSSCVDQRGGGGAHTLALAALSSGSGLVQGPRVSLDHRPE
jgi:hypothetical protein